MTQVAKAKRWRGFCSICRADLYRDPLRHYTSRSHLDRVAAHDRARARKAAGRPRPDDV